MQNRDYKFRAWDDAKKKWLLGYEMQNLGGFSLFGETVMLGEWAGILDEYIFERNGHKQSDLKVMQFIGMKDRCGIDAYEDDLVVDLRGITCRIVYVAAGFSLQPISGLIEDGANVEINYSTAFVVEGNVWENPGMLEGKCKECGGTGELSVEEQVYAGEPHMAPIGSEPCPSCQPKKEPSEE